MYNRKEKMVRRGSIYYADLNPVTGSEQGGIRPVIVIQNNCGNVYSPTVIVAATTGQLDKPFLPTHVLIEKSDKKNKLTKNTIVMLEQIRTIDRSRLRSYIGQLNYKTLQCLDMALSVSVGLNL